MEMILTNDQREPQWDLKLFPVSSETIKMCEKHTDAF